MHFDGTVTLGTLISAGTFALAVSIACYKTLSWLNDRFELLAISFARFEERLGDHASKIERHSERMDRYESHYVKTANEIQRVIGWLDNDRRGHHRQP